MNKKEIIDKLKEKGLKVTPQRMAIFEAIFKLDNHPAAEQIISHVQKNYPNIAVGTVYKVLDSLVENHLIDKVKTETGTMRYDPLLTNHHHLYCMDTNEVKDYEDSELDTLISDYFKKKQIKNFQIKDIKLQITGKFNHRK